MQESGTFIKLLKVARGHIVLGGVLAFTLGALLAVAGGGTFNPYNAILFYAVVFFGDLSTHYSNDYFDVNLDKTESSAKFFSGRRILVKNPNLLPHARSIAIALMAISIVLAGATVVFQIAPIEVLLIAVGANFLGWFYSAPPLRLSSKGLGETAIALAVGFAIPAVGYLSVKGQLDVLFWVFALPFVLYGFMLALSLEAPDIEVDRKGNRKNIGVRIGKRAVFGLMLAAALAAFACFAFYVGFISGSRVNFLAVSVLSAVPLAAGILGFSVALRKKPTDTFGAINVLSLFAFNVLMIVSLAVVVLYG